MKFEKLNNDKIRIILNLQDLKEKDIDYQSFMSNSSDAQELFMDMLEEAEKKIGFITKDYKIMIEALATIDGNFIITVTRSKPDELESLIKKRNLKIKRKRNITSDTYIYKFNTFDDVCYFFSYVSSLNMTGLNKFTKDFSLYTYNNLYFLVMGNVDKDFKYLQTFLTVLTEFGEHINIPDLFKNKLFEYGQVVIRNNIYKTINKFF